MLPVPEGLINSSPRKHVSNCFQGGNAYLAVNARVKAAPVSWQQFAHENLDDDDDDDDLDVITRIREK